MPAAAALRTLTAALLLTGCATTKPGVIAVKRIDRSQFEVTTHVIGSPGGVDGVKAQNDDTATKFCEQKGLAMLVLDRRSYGGVAAQDILTFRCGSSPMARAKPAAAQATATR